MTLTEWLTARRRDLQAFARAERATPDFPAQEDPETWAKRFEIWTRGQGPASAHAAPAPPPEAET